MILIQYRLQLCSIRHLHYTPFICDRALLKFWNFEFLSAHILNFQSFKIPHIWIANVFKMCLIGYYHLTFFTINLILLYESFVKMSFFNDKKIHFQKSLIKPKPKIGANGFLIWVSWHSCVLKRNNVPRLTWFQIPKNLTPFVAPLSVFWPFHYIFIYLSKSGTHTFLYFYF